MKRNITVSEIALSMRDFQKNNNIKKQCITNTQYLYDCIKPYTNVKAKAIFVVSTDTEIGISVIVEGHLVVSNDNAIIEPSYDIFCLKNKIYCDNIKDLMNTCKDKINLTNMDIKRLVCKHIIFIKFAEQINNGELIICDKKFYDDQADYIENLYQK